jgi:hypothetical protein
VPAAKIKQCVHWARAFTSRRKAASVLNFRSTPKTRSSATGAYRRRLILLFGTLLLVIYMMGEIRSDRFIGFIGQLFREPAQKRPGKRVPANTKPVVIATHDDDSAERQPLAAPDLDRPFHERVRHDLLEALEENGRFLPKEMPAFTHLLGLLNETEAAAIEAAPAERVTRIELWTQSAAYRGKFVSVAGRVRGVFQKPLRNNPDGIAEYYEIYLQPEGHSTEPIVAYCLELPPGFPLSSVEAKIDEEVVLKGFYYRRWWHESQEGNRVDPLMLIKTFAWTPPAPAAAKPQLNVPLAISVVLAVAIVATALVVWWSRGSSRKNEMPDYVRRYAEDSRGDSVGDALRRLEE